MATGKRILVTGANGFVGMHLMQALIARGEKEIFAVVHGVGGPIESLLDATHIKQGDLTDADFTLSLIQQVKPDVIYHLAALAVVHDSVEKAGQVLTANIKLQYNLLEAVRMHAPMTRVMVISSGNAYGLVRPEEIPINENAALRPLNPYAVSKLAQEMLAYQYYLAHQLDIVRLRPFNHTGEGQTTDFVIPALAQQFVDIAKGQKEPKIEIGNTESVRDFTDVKDMVQAYIVAADKCAAGEVYNIGYGKGISIGEIVNLLQEIAGVKVELVRKDEKVRPSDVPILVADSTKFRQATGWEPQYSLKDTLTRVYQSLLAK